MVGITLEVNAIIGVGINLEVIEITGLGIEPTFLKGFLFPLGLVKFVEGLIIRHIAATIDRT